MTHAAFLTGLLASIILVIGSAWPATKTKDRLFLVGNFGMLAYSILGYLNGSPIFFIFLELLCVSSSVLFMLKVPEKTSTRLIAILGAVLLLASLYFLEGTNTVFFILGLIALALGFITQKEVKRNTFFIAGCILIATFSYIENSMIFFWLNTIFGVFSTYYLLKALKKH